MDFDQAVNKLAQNHSKQLRRGRIQKNSNLSGNRHASTHLSLRAKKEAEERKRKTEEQRMINQVKKNKLRKAYAYYKKCEEMLGTEYSLSAGGDGRLLLKPTSIFGEGDKISLPVSALPVLMELKDKKASGISSSSSPFEFRVGILNPKYKFPMSPLINQMMENMNGLDDADEDDISMGDSDDEEDDPSKHENSAFLDELSCKYLAYTHCTVVEFTQEEGHIGLPQSISRALLNNDKSIPVTRTKDPATISPTEEEDLKIIGQAEEVQNTSNSPMQGDDSDENKTPGHLAWGAFDIPDLEVEVVLVSLPKGKACTLVPTKQSMQNGFYQLKDIKAALEQSLIRTKATLSLNDNVHCWYRGKKFDMIVSSLTPNTYNAVSCINTDIEVDIGCEDHDTKKLGETAKEALPLKIPTTKTNVGRVLGRSLHSSSDNTEQQKHFTSPVLPLESFIASSIPPEPPSDEKENICLIQIRGDGKAGRRKFDIKKTTVMNLYTYAASVVGGQSNSFRLVTRFPRKVLELGDINLKEAGLQEGQEMFIIEKC